MFNGHFMFSGLFSFAFFLLADETVKHAEIPKSEFINKNVLAGARESRVHRLGFGYFIWSVAFWGADFMLKLGQYIRTYFFLMTFCFWT